MAILTRPANVQKNIAATFVIDYAEVAALPAVPAGYYKDTSNWKNVFVKVKHSSGQKNIIQYALPSTEGSLLVSDTARAGTWEVYSILIRDFDKGEVVIDKANIPSQASLNFNVVSAASHGDLIVGPGQTVSVPANGKRQYGDIIVEAGGTLEIADGGGILELEALGNCVINGTILGRQGKHTGGTWSSTSVLSEALVHAITQKAGGAGGQGEGIPGPPAEVATELIPLANQSNTNAQGYTVPGYSILPAADYELKVNIISSASTIQLRILGLDPATDAVVSSETVVIAAGIGMTTYVHTVPADYQYKVAVRLTSAFSGKIDWDQMSFKKVVAVSAPTPGGVGGAAAFGNGGGGGRAAKFVAQAGGNAIDVTAGIGAGSFTGATVYGAAGASSAIPSEAAGGGFRGAHGQAIYIKASRIQGSGTIDVSGQNGGNGGAGGEYLSEGELYANGSGGGGAGGDGGKVWLRAKKGTPSLNVIVTGGERGARGVSSPGAIEAEHGVAGSVGAYSFANY